ncbi:MAG: 50S ribosomal protein L23 [Candidatus Pacearchaeota archaeon]
MIIKPITTEKAVRLIEADNIILFEVSSRDNQSKIKENVEKLFKVKVEKINVLNKGAKKIAYVKIDKKTPAIDIATKLGVI